MAECVDRNRPRIIDCGQGRRPEATQRSTELGSFVVSANTARRLKLMRLGLSVNNKTPKGNEGVK